MDQTEIHEELIDSIITNLKIISIIQKDDKLCIRKGHLQIDKSSYFRFIKRYYYNDCRSSIILFMKGIIKNIKIVKPYLKKESINNMSQIELGISNLKVSYSDDPIMIAFLDNILNKLKESLGY